MAKKNLKRGLALGALMAFVITGSAMAAFDISYKALSSDLNESNNVNVIKNVENNDIVVGVGASSGYTANFTGSNIEFNLSGYGQAFGILAQTKQGVGNGTIILGSQDSIVNIKTLTQNDWTAGVELEGRGDNGVAIADGAEAIINGKTLSIDVTSLSDDVAFGLNVANKSIDLGGFKPTKLVINSDKTTIKATGKEGKAIPIVVMSQGVLEINGDLKAYGSNNVISTRGDSHITINKDGKHTVELEGDILFSYDGPTSGTPIDADVNITLSGSDSVWQGNAKTAWNKMSEANYSNSNIKDEILKVTGLSITLQDDAKWIVTQPVENEEKTVDGYCSGQQYIGINNLKMNNGRVDLTKVKELASTGKAPAIEIGVLDGSGAIFDMNNYNTIKVETLKNNDVTLNSGTIKFVGGDTKITGKLTLNKGADIVESNDEHVPAMNLTLAKGSKLVIDNLNNYLKEYNGGETYAVISTKKGTVTAEEGAKISIGTASEGTYKIVEAAKVVNKMSDEDVTFDGGLKTGTWINSDKEMNLKVAIKNLKEETELVPTENAGLVEAALKNINNLNKNNNTQQLADFFNKISQLAEEANSGTGKAQVKAAIASSVQSGTNNGAASTAASVVNNVSSITNNRLSIVAPAPKGGMGVGLFAEESGAGVWAQYLHGKDKAEDLPSGSSKTQYKNSYNGIVVGADFKKVDKFQSGVAFSYTDGDGSNSSTTGGTLGSTGHTDFKSYGVTYYGSIKNDDTNTMFDIGYNHSKADSDTNILLTGHTDSSTSKTNTWSAGVTVEKSYTDGNNGAQFIPYAGVRYMNINTDDFTTQMGYKNVMDDQNVFMIPVGIKFRQENVYKNGWKVTPKADLSYIWAMGDTDSNVNVTIPGLPSEPSVIGYTVMDDGSFLGTVGIEAEKGDWTYGLSYSYQKGEYQRSDKWFVDVRYSF